MKRQLSILAIAFVLFVTKYSAQDTSNLDDKPYITLGLGYGYALANPLCVPCGEENSIIGYSFIGTVGFRLNKKFLFDFTPHTWGSIGKNDNKTTRTGILIRVYYSPFKKCNLQFIGGIGFRNYTFTPDTAITIAINQKTLGTVFGIGPEFTAGIGYEFKLHTKFRLIPAFSSYVSTPGNFKVFDLYEPVLKNKRASILGELLITLRYVY